MKEMFKVSDVDARDGVVVIEVHKDFVGQVGRALRAEGTRAAFALGAICGQADRVLNHGAPISEMTHDGQPTVSIYTDAEGHESILRDDGTTSGANECDDLFEPAATAPAGDAVAAE